MPKRILNLLIIAAFFLSLVTPIPQAHAESLLGLPEPGTMISLSPSYEPILIKGLKVHSENPFLFDFILDTGNDQSQQSLKPEAEKLIKYFLAAMTIPEKDLWVNLSPYEKNRMIASNLAQTEMGRDMLAQDYMLKQLSASLIYPEKDLGRTFWDEVYAKARQLYGTTQIPVDTFNKVWIVADKADVYERDNVAYVVGAHLKVMLEEDYQALQKHQGQLVKPTTSQTSSLASEIVRKVVLPEIENEVNSGKNFSLLRQMFYSMILASWYKGALKNAILTQVYGNQSKVRVGINQTNPQVNEEIFNRYLRAYKKGVFNYIKDDMDRESGETIPRKYFSGGEQIWGILKGPRVLHNVNGAMSGPHGHLFIAKVDTFPARINTAMKSGKEKLKKYLPKLRLTTIRGERPEDIRVKVQRAQVEEFLNWYATGKYRESLREALEREAEGEFMGDKSNAFLFNKLPKSLRRNRELVYRLILRIVTNGTKKIRMSNIIETPLTEKEQRQVLDRIKEDPFAPIIALDEKTIEKAISGDFQLDLSKTWGLIPEGIRARRTLTLSHNVVELLSKVPPGSLNGVYKTMKRVQIKIGVFFRIPVKVQGRTYYLMQVTSQGVIKPWGGGMEFINKAMSIQQSNAVPAVEPKKGNAIEVKRDIKPTKIDSIIKANRVLALLGFIKKAQEAGKLEIPDGYPKIELPDPEGSNVRRVMFNGQEALRLNEQERIFTPVYDDDQDGIYYVGPLTIIVKNQGVTYKVNKGDYGRRLDKLSITEEPGAPPATAAMKVTPGITPGGIDLNANHMQMGVQKEGQGVDMRINSSMIARIKTEGFDGMEFNIRSILPLSNLPVLLGLGPSQDELAARHSA